VRHGPECQKQKMTTVARAIDQRESEEDQFARQLRRGLLGCQMDRRFNPGIEYLPEIAAITGMAQPHRMRLNLVHFLFTVVASVGV